MVTVLESTKTIKLASIKKLIVCTMTMQAVIQTVTRGSLPPIASLAKIMAVSLLRNIWASLCIETLFSQIKSLTQSTLASWAAVSYKAWPRASQVRTIDL